MNTPAPFTFVPVSAPTGGKNRATRSAVRRHAMQQVWQERKRRTAPAQQPSDLEILLESEETTYPNPSKLVKSRLRHREPPSDTSSERSDLVDIFGEGRSSTLVVSPDALRWSQTSSGSEDIATCDRRLTPTRLIKSKKKRNVMFHNRNVWSGTSNRRSITLELMTRAPSPGNPDPFSACAITLDWQSNYYIDYYRRALSWKLTMPKTFWLSYAITDPCLLHGILFTSSALYSLATGGHLSRDALMHQGVTIHLLNKTIPDPVLGISDHTIAAVARLATGHVVFGNVPTWKTHIKAVETMVKLRGGLEKLGFDGQLAYLIVCNVLCGACISDYQVPPSMHQPYDPAYSPYLAAAPEHCFDPEQSEAFQALVGPTGLSEELCRVFVIMRQLNDFLAIEQRKWNDSEQLAFSMEVNTVTQRILDLDPSKLFIDQEDPAIESSVLNLRESCRIAMHFYVFAILREVPNLGAIYSLFVAKLKPALSHTDLESCWGGDERGELLLWVLIVCGSMTRAKVERGWLGYWTRTTIQTLDVENWDQAKSILKQFMWLEGVCDIRYRPFWDEFCE